MKIIRKIGVITTLLFAFLLQAQEVTSIIHKMKKRPKSRYSNFFR